LRRHALRFNRQRFADEMMAYLTDVMEPSRRAARKAA
jgi:hypothetical protein